MLSLNVWLGLSRDSLDSPPPPIVEDLVVRILPECFLVSSKNPATLFGINVCYHLIYFKTFGPQKDEFLPKKFWQFM